MTDDSIAIGYGDDSGYANAPGLNEEMGDAMDAMIKWCNGLGGINGRQIVGHRYDAALDNAAQVIVEACGQDFMLVGQGFAGDEDMEADRVACQLVDGAGLHAVRQRQQRPDELRAAAVPGRQAQHRARPS